MSEKASRDNSLEQISPTGSSTDNSPSVARFNQSTSSLQSRWPSLTILTMLPEEQTRPARPAAARDYHNHNQHLPRRHRDSFLTGPDREFTALQFAQHEQRIREAAMPNSSSYSSLPPSSQLVSRPPPLPPIIDLPIRTHRHSLSWSSHHTAVSTPDRPTAPPSQQHVLRSYGSEQSIGAQSGRSNVGSYRSYSGSMATVTPTSTNSATIMNSFSSLSSAGGAHQHHNHQQEVNSYPRGGYSINILDDYMPTTSPKKALTRPDRAGWDLERASVAAAGSTDSVVDKAGSLTPACPDCEQRRQEEKAKREALPAKRQPKPVRNLRHISLGVYRRLFSLVFIGNMVALALYIAQRGGETGRMAVPDLATAASANILVAILIRQDYIVNLLFRLCWMVPLSAPLRIRRLLAKVYENGGVHSGAAVSGTIWFALLTVVLTLQTANKVIQSVSVLTISYVLLVLLLLIIVFAYPGLRSRSHNTFEMTHRFAGWCAVGLFWAELVLLLLVMPQPGLSFGQLLIRQPTFWFLVVITFHLVLPWLRLRKWNFRPEVLSPHALRLHFDQTLKPFSGLAISDNPLFEWHQFATFPAVELVTETAEPLEKPAGSTTITTTEAVKVASPSPPGGSIVVSKAGDWTSKTILDPKKTYWVKGVPRTGVLSMAAVFRRVVIVTTGSGIGPCLSFLLEQRNGWGWGRGRSSPEETADADADTEKGGRTGNTTTDTSHGWGPGKGRSLRRPTRLLWSTPAPERTFGARLCATVRSVDPDVLIHDTKVHGRADMVALTYRLVVESGAEAVFVISNPRLTKKVVYGMESRGIPAYGPIWDS